MTGILDSGVGGLFLLKALSEKRADTQFIYLADQKHFPYGEKSLSFVRFLVQKNVEFLSNQGAGRIIVACNTASAVLEQESKSPVPVMGVITASLKQAEKDSQNGQVGVLATEGTVRSQAFLREKKNIAPHLNIYQKACPLLAPFVEKVSLALCSGTLMPTAKSRLFSLLDSYLPPLLQKGVDTIIMACTHYLYLKPMLEQYLPKGIKVVGPVDFLIQDFLSMMKRNNKQQLKNMAQWENPLSKAQKSQPALPSAPALVHLFVSGEQKEGYKKMCHKMLGSLFTVQRGGHVSI